MDSGATCNLISAKVVQALGLPVLSGPKVALRQADGSPLAVASYCELQIALEGHGPWRCVALVAPLLACEVILSTRFLVENHGTLVFNPVLCLEIPEPGTGRKLSLFARTGSDPRPMVATAAPPTLPSNVVAPPPLPLPRERVAAPPFELRITPSELADRKKAVSEASFSKFEALLPTIESPRLREVIAAFREVFPDKLYRCPPPDRTTRNHSIELIPGVVLPQSSGYPVPQAYRDVMKAKLEEMLAAHVIQRSTGTPRAVSAGFLVKGKKPRLVGDYRGLNDATVLRAQDLPTVQCRLDLLARALWFTLMDMITGFHQLGIRKDDQDLTTLAVATFGRFYYVVTAMGLKNAPTDFQRAVEAPLRATGGFDLWVFNYLDDLLVFSETEDEHVEHVRSTLGELKDDWWTISAEKIQPGVRRIHILGHWVERGAIHPDPDYIKKVHQLPSPDVMPNKIKGLQCLLGLFGYYRRFIPDFSSIATPLTNLLRKDTPWKWGPEEETSRRLLSDRLQEAIDNGMRIFRGDLPLRICTDASGTGLGAVLEQLFDDNVWHPVAFHSVALSPVEARLLNYERELLAIFSACKKWLSYLVGVHFTVCCDCAVLRNISTMTLLGRRRRVVTMLLFLRTLWFTWVHVPGKHNGAADAFSRLHESVLFDDAELLSGLPGAPMAPGDEFAHPSLDDDLEEFVASVFDGHVPSMDDDELLEMINSIIDGSSLPSVPAPAWVAPSQKDQGFNEFVALLDDCSLTPEDAVPWDEHSVLAFFDEGYLPEEILSEEESCCLIHPISGAEFVPRDHLDPHQVFLVTSVMEFQVPDIVCPATSAPAEGEPGSLWNYAADPAFASIWERTSQGPVNKYRRDKSGKLLLLKDLIVVPKDAVPTVLSELHVSYSHVAQKGLLRSVSDRGFWWPRREADVAAFVAACPTCRLKSLSRGIIYGSPGERDVLDKGQEIAVDFTHVLPAVGGFDAVLGIVDRTSRYTMWLPAATTWRTADFIRAIVTSWVSVFGLPRIVRSDNGPTFIPSEWVRYWEAAGCRVSHCAPYHPQGNGIVERSFRTLKSRLSAHLAEDSFTSWVDMLPYVQGAANSLSRAVLGGLTPSEVVLGFKPRWECLPSVSLLPAATREHWLNDNARREAAVLAKLRVALIASVKEAKVRRAKKHRPWSPKAGDLVLVKRSALANAPSGSQLWLGWIGPVRVLSVLDHNVEISWNSASRHFALGQLRPWGGDSSPSHSPAI